VSSSVIAKAPSPGAISDRAGKFEQANRGTLLLDEIGEIGVQMQAKLLQVLQDGHFARLGAQETTKVDVRVLAATNVLMEDALFAKTFREDLYYRLSVFTIKVPSLRERREEIPYLIEEFIRRSPAELTSGFGSSLPSRLMDAALLCDWKGNLRELRNFVTSAPSSCVTQTLPRVNWKLRWPHRPRQIRRIS
jgi:two-component system, NtrC family, response regulator AtoC